MTTKPLTIENACAEADKFIETIPTYPNRYSGRGIVICGGGVRYYTCAWVCINMLRRWGCNLPIQLWHLGPTEITEHMKSLLKPLAVECVDGLEIRKQCPARILNGWELKVYSIIHSPFKEVMFLDADNVPTLNPEFLFDTAQFKETGAIFWPDYGRLSPDRSIWKLCRVPYRDEPEFETGQIVIDKERCWKPLCLSMWYNEHSDFYYHHIHGDKETFHMAFHRLNQPYSMPDIQIHTLRDDVGNGKVMCQHDFDGRRIFQHRNCDKWDLFDGNMRLDGFRFEQECRQYLEELRSLWHKDQSQSYVDIKVQTKQIRKIITEIIQTTFDYHRVGFDHRPMTFLENGVVGKGSARCEIFWNVKEDENGKVILEISSFTEATCWLTRDSDKVWRGRWINHERMPIELSPTGKVVVVPDKNEQNNKFRSTAIDFAITTVARRGNYIHKLIPSLRADLPLHLVVGSPDSKYLSRYKNNPFVKIYNAPDEDWEHLKDYGVHQLASWNYWRALVYGANNPMRQGLVVFEDDVVPSPIWESRLYEVINCIEHKHNEGHYLLALYTANILGQPQKNANFYIPYPVDCFFGTQVIYYPEPVRAGFAYYLKKNGVDLYRNPYDILLQEYLSKMRIPLYVTCPCLFQHVGEISTGLGEFHQAHQFQAV